MTEQKNTNENDLQNGTSKADDDIRYQEVKPVNNKRSGLIGSAVAILVILAIGGGLYYYTTQQATKLSTENQSLKSQLAQLQQLQDTYQQRFDNIDSQFNSQNSLLINCKMNAKLLSVKSKIYKRNLLLSQVQM
ncbi:putative uroporphyrinogen III C-methyltransferase [Proteus mirabilis]|uniref:Putative uroporphyrinogen III C-methyltransferase n=1 Tax=Proteus mirabilis TaxID=584 RepID=A0A379FEC1_PROMI|nr:putative uroporphyrinogen III C-methyltransferase [Proteus mirabilis]